MNRVSNVSFGSTYNVRLKDNDYEKYMTSAELDIESVDESAETIPFFTPGKEERRIIVDDKYDEFVETFFKSNNIVFHKKTSEELNNPDNIIARMVVPNAKYGKDRYLPTLIGVDAKKFNDAFRSSFQYIGDYPNISDKSRCDSFKDYIKTDLPIEAAEVYINDENGKPGIYFQDGRHRYAYLRDMGLSTIPVAMNLESFNNALKFNLLSSEKRVY